MNIRECYDTIGADFEDVLGRLGSESLIQRFALKFIDDGSYNELTEASTSITSAFDIFKNPPIYINQLMSSP